MASLARERALCDGERTELRSGSDPPYAIKRRGKHGKSNCKACHQRRAETEKQETTKDTNKTALDALFVPPSLHRLAACILLNEVKAERFKKTVQTLSYLPNFVSWVVVVQLMTTIFTPYGGIFNDIRQMMGKEAIFVMGEKNAFLPLVIFSDLWQNVGWGSIVYLAAITGVDQGLYEAAAIDCAGRWKCTWHITIPEISVTIGIMFIMAVGGMLNAGYDQILLLQQPANNQISQVLDTYIIQTGIRYGKFEYATAIGLFKSVFSLIMVAGTNYLTQKYAEVGLW